MLDEDEIARRLACFSRTEDARALWPDVTPAAFRAAQEEVARVAAAVLADAARPVALRVPPPADLRTLGIGAMTAGMGALLGWWIETGRVAADAEARTLFAAHLEQGRLRAAFLRRELELVVGAFADRGVEPVVLKGAETAYRYFPDPATRPTADLDLLVAPRDLRGAEDALRSLGFTQDEVLVPQRGHWLPAVRGRVRSLEMADAGNPWHVDLHVSLDRRQAPGIVSSLGAVDPAAAEPWAALRRAARVLPQPLHLAHLALHASSDFYMLPMIRLVELVLVARRDYRGRAERWTALRELLRRSAAERFVFPALRLAEDLAPGTFDAGLLASTQAASPRLLRRAVGALTPGSSQRLHERPGFGVLLWPATPRESVAAFLGAIWPRTGRERVSLRVLAGLYSRRIRRAFRALTGSG
jgi:hypothetical protein